MSRDISIAYTVADNMSAVLREIKSNQNLLTNDVSEYQKIKQEAFDQKTEIKFETTMAQKELSALQSEFKNLYKEYDEGSDEFLTAENEIKEAMSDQIKLIESKKYEYSQLTKVMNDAQKAEQEYLNEVSKSDNANSSRTGTADTTASALLSASLYKEVGSVVSSGITDVASQYVTSAFGETTGNAISSVLSSTLSSAATGFALGGGPMGAAVLGTAGLVSGGLSAYSQVKAKDDEIFKEYVTDTYDTISTSRSNSLENGSSLAGQRELDVISYTTLLGSEENSSKFLADTTEFASKTPFEINNLLDLSKTLLTYKFEQDELLDILQSIGDASSALGLSHEDQTEVAKSLGRMNSEDKVTTRYTDVLTARAIPAIDYLADAYDKSNAEIKEMISRGEISGIEASKIIIDAMGEANAGNMELQSVTFSGLTSTYNDLMDQIDMAMGEGFNEARKDSLADSIAFYGENESLKEGYRLIGEFQASVANEYDNAIIKTLEDAMNSDDYKLAIDTGNSVLAGELLAEAQVNAEYEYKNSHQYQLMLESELNLLEQIQGSVDISDGYFQLGKQSAEEWSKGYASVSRTSTITQIADTTDYSTTTSNPSGKGSTSTSTYSSSTYNPSGKGGDYTPYSVGLSRVPYDGFKAELHEGECILTRTETDQLDNKPREFIFEPVLNDTNGALDAGAILSSEKNTSNVTNHNSVALNITADSTLDVQAVADLCKTQIIRALEDFGG